MTPLPDARCEPGPPHPTALADSPAYVREYRLEGVRRASAAELPRSASFPDDGRQGRFFASPLWRDRLSFDPGAALASQRGPVLVLVGTDDPNPPLDVRLGAVRRGLSRAASPDAEARVLAGRTRHTFSAGAVGEIVAWLAPRLSPSRPPSP